MNCNVIFKLFQRGVQQSYELGQFLRDWYEGFLSRRYERREVGSVLVQREIPHSVTF